MLSVVDSVESMSLHARLESTKKELERTLNDNIDMRERLTKLEGELAEVKGRLERLKYIRRTETQKLNQTIFDLKRQNSALRVLHTTQGEGKSQTAPKF